MAVNTVLADSIVGAHPDVRPLAERSTTPTKQVSYVGMLSTGAGKFTIGIVRSTRASPPPVGLKTVNRVLERIRTRNTRMRTARARLSGLSFDSHSTFALRSFSVSVHLTLFGLSGFCLFIWVIMAARLSPPPLFGSTLLLLCCLPLPLTRQRSRHPTAPTRPTNQPLWPS
jgi:hypothetical protein